jgi:hypothetical protein
VVPRIKSEETYEYDIFCSKQFPALIGEEGEEWGPEESKHHTGKWSASFLQPGDSYDVFGVSEGSYAMYWAACHGVDIDGDPYSAGNKLGRRFGYPFRPDPNTDPSQSETICLG